LPFKFVLYLISQAVVRRHIGSSAAGLVPLDLATCEQIVTFIDKLGDRKERKPSFAAAGDIQGGDMGATPDAAAKNDNQPTGYAAILKQATDNINAYLKDSKSPLKVGEESLEQAFKSIKEDSVSKFLTKQDKNTNPGKNQ
jgi:hypothetical protein